MTDETALGTPQPRIEKERKYLVRGRPWVEDPWQAQTTSASVVQAYLNLHPDRTVRVRVENDDGYLTVKGRAHDDERVEYEYRIPTPDARFMLENLAEGERVEKIRHTLPVGAYVWQIDEYLGRNAGLVVAEVEYRSAAPTTLGWPPVPLPEFIGDDLTILPAPERNRYFNASLAGAPYVTWPDKHRAVDGHLRSSSR